MKPSTTVSSVITDPTPKNGTEGLYRHQGLAWLDAAKILHDNKQSGGLGPFYYLVSHAFELFTKAFLLHRGVKHDELEKKLGHNVVALTNRAKELSLELEEEYTPLIEAFKNLNKDHMQRYSKTGVFTLGQRNYVEPECMIEWVKKYYKKIYEIIKEDKNF